MTKGRLRCDHCGQSFIVRDGQSYTIDHFDDCPGLDGDGHA